jgi:diguanylate cyclase
MSPLLPDLRVDGPEPELAPPSWWTFSAVYLPVASLPLVVWGIAALRAGRLDAPGLLLGVLATAAVGGAMAWLFAERRRAESIRTDLDRLVRTDPLTGLSNRRALYEALDVWSRRASRLGLPLTLLLMDLDDFKAINDQRGHATGDAVLRAFAEALRESTRADQDLLFRLGGDEFVVLLIGTDAGGAEVVAERLSARCHGAGAEDLQVACSIGAATRRPDEDLEVWLQRADAAMYAAKPQRERGAGGRRANLA